MASKYCGTVSLKQGTSDEKNKKKTKLPWNNVTQSQFHASNGRKRNLNITLLVHKRESSLMVLVLF